MLIEHMGYLFRFVGGLGMFLYGMHIMAEGLQRSAGGRMQKLLGFLTRNRVLAVMAGALITAIIQSSSATTVMVVGFVNAGLMDLTQAVGVIMGANIGTTITAWLVSMSEWGSIFKPEFFAPLLLGIGAVLFLFTGKESKQKVGGILVGFSILFIGLDFMSGAIKPYRDAPVFSQAFAVMGKNPLLAVLAGLVVTGIIQSSSASVGILQTLALNGVVNWKAAVFITLGQNIGTCVTAMVSGASGSRNGKRASLIHLSFNVIGAVVFGMLMWLVFWIFPSWGASRINSVEISVFHTIFNVCNTLLLFPFAGKLVALAKILLPEGPEEIVKEDEVQAMKRRLDSRIMQSPAIAIKTVSDEAIQMGELALENVRTALLCVDSKKAEGLQEVLRKENCVDLMEKMLTEYLVDLDSELMTEEQHNIMKDLFYMVNDLERISDHAMNIGELAKRLSKSDKGFSDKGRKDLAFISGVVLRAADTALQARREQSVDRVLEVKKLEDQVDILEGELREKHIRRLAKGKCAPESGVIFLDLIGNLERIADHASNIAGYVLQEEKGKNEIAG